MLFYSVYVPPYVEHKIPMNNHCQYSKYDRKLEISYCITEEEYIKIKEKEKQTEEEKYIIAVFVLLILFYLFYMIYKNE